MREATMSNNGTQAQAREARAGAQDADMASIIDAAIERSEARWRAAEAARQPKLALGEVLQLAQTISGSPTLPDWIRKPGDVVAVVLRGQELGIPPMSALSLLSLIKGKTVIDATAMRGVLLARGFRFRWGACNDKVATLIVTRPEKGAEPETFTYTLEEARTAKLADKENWKANPVDMLAARVSSRACRRVGGDVLAGCYSPEEIDDDSPIAQQRADATAKVLAAPLPSKTTTVYVLADEVAGLSTPEDVRTWWACHGHEVTALAADDAKQVKRAVSVACKRVGLDPKELANAKAKPAPAPVESHVEPDADGASDERDPGADEDA